MSFEKTHNQFHKVYMHNVHNGKTDTIYLGYYTKRLAWQEFKELRDSNEWTCIVFDDITKEEFDKRIKRYTP